MPEDTRLDGVRASALVHIPHTLRALDRWMRWHLESDGGKPRKKPVGSTKDPTNAYPFTSVADDLVGPKGGIGLNMTGGIIRESDGAKLLAFDMDACRDPQSGAVSAWANVMLREYGGSYTEVTPSGSGLRMWLWVINPPTSLPIIPIPEPAPAGIEKKVEIQTFGCGPAGYVTVSGDRLKSTNPEPLTAQNLDWLLATYGVKPKGLSEIGDDLPKGSGEPPTSSEILAAVLAGPNGREMVEGEWETLGKPSASEVWRHLVMAALKAGRHHGESVVEFLMHETDFGTGEVDSKDPDKYARLDWVVADVCRVASKEGATAEAVADTFGAFDCEAFEIPARAPSLEDAARPKDEPWLLTLDDFGETFDEDETHLVYNVFPMRGIAQIFGEPGCGKTPYAISLAIHVALGIDWFGHEIENQGPVVYMVGEDSTGVNNRFTGQLEVSSPGTRRRDVPILVTTRPGQLLDPDNAKQWVEKIKAIHPQVSLLVVDTKNRNFGPGNENDSEDMTAFVSSLDYIVRSLGCLILLVNHTGHADKNRARGSSVLFGSLDSEAKISRKGTGVRAVFTKAKNFALPADLVGELDPVVVRIDRKGRDVTAITLDQIDPADAFTDVADMELIALLEVLAATGGAPTSQASLMSELGITRKTLRIRTEKAEDLGFLALERGEGRKPSRYMVLGMPETT